MKKKIILIVLGCVSLMGCTRNYYIVRRDVPMKPTLVVLPFNDFKDQIDIANAVESIIISAGVKVVERPFIKEVEMRSGMEGQKINGGESSSNQRNNDNRDIEIDSRKAGANKIERYRESNITADYIVYTSGEISYGRLNRIINDMHLRVVKRDGDEVLASAYVRPDKYDEDITSILKSIGIKVYDGKE